jgi:hypothetical protein
VTATDLEPIDQTNRDWILRAARGDVRDGQALDYVRAARRHVAGFMQSWPELVAALMEGDARYPDDDRWPDPIAPWDVAVDVDPDTTAAFIAYTSDPAAAEVDALLDRHASGADAEHGGQVRRLRSVTADTPSLLERFRAALLDTDAVEAMPPAEPLIADWLDLDTLAVIYGPPGVGKTFLSVDMALHVASGTYWHGRDVASGPVLYVIGEGARGIGKRTRAWKEHHRLYSGGRHAIRWLPEAVQLGDAMQVEAFAQLAAEVRPSLIVFDTLARCTVGVEENNATTMGVVVEALDAIRRESGACVLCLHHTGKDVSLGARGSNALKGAIDTEIEVSADSGRVSLALRKQKDGLDGLRLELERIAVADSCVLVPAGSAPSGPKLRASLVQALDALEAVAIPGGVASGAWFKSSGMPESSFYRARKQLLDLGLVTTTGEGPSGRWSVVEADTAEAGDAA